MRDWSRFPERYWIEVTGAAQSATPPTEDSGFLWRSDLLPHTQKTVVLTRSLPECECLILLGESGTGKTCEAERLSEARPGSVNLFLGTVTMKSDIVEFFRYALAAKPSGIIDISLDGWDECIIPVAILSKIIHDQLSSLPLDRIRLRLASRSGNWTQSVQELVLKPYIDKGLAPRSFAICPFLRIDAKQLAQQTGLKPDEFLDALTERDATPLAAFPQSLKLLITIFQCGGPLPTTKVDLYDQGVRALCAEKNAAMSGRSRSELAGRILAAKAAAVTSLFTGRPLIGSMLADTLPPDAIRFEDALSLHPSLHEADYQEALGSALFRSVGNGLHLWSHRSFAEFFSAQFLLERQIPLRQIDQVLNHVADRQRVAPQLEGIASWLAALLPEYAMHLAKRQPELVLAGETSSVGNDIKHAMVERIIANAALAPDLAWRTTPLARLSHSGLETQLRAVMLDASRPPEQRWMAVAIARACDVKALANDTLTLARNESLEGNIRSLALRTFVGWFDATRVSDVIPFAMGSTGRDPEDDLRAFALSSLWPTHLDTVNLLALLGPPSRPHFFGSYRSFLIALPDSIAQTDLPVALRWACWNAWKYAHFEGDAIGALSKSFIARAFTLLNHSEIRRVVAEMVAMNPKDAWRVLPREVHGLPGGVTDDDRRALILDILKIVIDGEFWNPGDIGWIHWFVKPNDFEWLFDALRSADSGARGPLAKMIAWGALSRWDSSFDAIYDAANNSPELKLVLDPLLVTPLDSDYARTSRAAMASMARSEKLLAERSAKDRPPTIQDALSLTGIDSRKAWYSTLAALAGGWQAGQYALTTPDKWPQAGWEKLDPAQQEQVLDAAVEFLRSPSVALRPQYGNGKRWSTDAFAAWTILRLLDRQRPDAVDAFGSSDWGRLAFVVLDSIQHDDVDRILCRNLAERLAASNESACLNALEVIVRGDDVAHHSIDTISKLERVPLAIFESRCMLLLRDEVLPLCNAGWLSLAEDLLERGCDAALVLAKSLSHQRVSASTGNAEGATSSVRAAVAAAAWFRGDPRTAFGTMLQEFEADAAWGRRVLALVLRHPVRDQAFAKVMDEVLLSKLYEWLVGQFPYGSRAEHSGAHFVDFDDEAERLRDSVLSELQSRGTVTAVAELQRLARTHAELSFLKRVAHVAQDKYLETSWSGVTQVELVALLRDGRSRIVGSADDLLALLLEAVDDYERRLHGEYSSVRDLWDQWSGNGVKKWRPIPEDDVSTHLARFLSDRLRGTGVVVGREVEIRRTTIAGTGEFTDLHVDAFRELPDRTRERVTVIMEMKGCWNPGLETDFESQLVNRYLRENDCRHGVYLIGWFRCPQWDASDGRNRACGSRDRQAVEAALALQAQRLATREGLTLKIRGIDMALRAPK